VGIDKQNYKALKRGCYYLCTTNSRCKATSSLHITLYEAKHKIEIVIFPTYQAPGWESVSSPSSLPADDKPSFPENAQDFDSSISTVVAYFSLLIHKCTTDYKC